MQERGVTSWRGISVGITVVCALAGMGAAGVGKEIPLKQAVGANQGRNEMVLGKLSHVMIGVSEMEQSLRFYRDKLGLRVIHSSKEMAFLDGNGVTITLSVELGKARRPLAGAIELVFGVTDIESVFRHLKDKGVAVLREPRLITGSDWAANFRDPDGHLLSIFGPKEGSLTGG